MVRVQNYLVVTGVVLAAATACTSTASTDTFQSPVSSEVVTTTASPTVPTAAPVFNPVEYYAKNPNEVPPALQNATAIVNRQLTGYSVITNLDFSGLTSVTVIVSCEKDARYDEHLGTAEKPRGFGFGGTSCGGQNLSSVGVPVKKGPFTQLETQVEPGVRYYVTIYDR